MFSIRDRLFSTPDGTDDDVADGGDEWTYEWTETAVEKVHGEPVISHAAPEDADSVFAGPLARQMIEGPRNNPDQPLYVGLGTRKGRHVGIERQFLFRHTCVFGVTGYGKSTLLKNSAKQVIESGHGCCFIDPKGQDSIELMQIIPDHRLDDVVWIEPGNNRSAVAGFNFLEVGVGEDDPMYDTAVENVVSDLVRMIGLDEYWGPLMDGVCSNLIRGTTRLERDFNLLDLYYILISPEAREEYAAMLEAEGLTFLADYAEKIEEMDDDDLDALQRRFKDWVEDPLARSAVAHRNTDIDIEGIVEDDKILIVRMAEQNEDLKEMIGTAILRRIWSAVRSRAATYDTEYDPFFLFADEFDLLATKDSSVTTMLSKARSLSLALFLCCQQPSQLPPTVVDAMYANCDTVLSFSPGSPKDARAVAKNLDMDPTTLRHESNYHVWTQLTLSETRERSEAFRTYCLPPFPPVRPESAAMHAIERTVRKLGREPLTDDEMRRGLILNGNIPDTDAIHGGGVSVDTQHAAAKAVHDAALAAGSDGGWIPLGDAADRVRAYTDAESDTDEQLYRNVIQHVDEDLLKVRENDTVELRASGRTQSRIYSVGGSESGGGASHAVLLREAYEALTREGGRVTIVDQEGGTAPDGIVESYEDGPIADLVGGHGAYLEAEKSTGDTKPGQTVRNLNAALDENRRCLFVAREDVAPRVHQTLAEEPVFARATPEGEGKKRFFNASRKLHIDGDVICRPGSRESVWIGTGEEIVLRDDEGDEHARFDDADEILNQRAWADTACVLVNDESAAPEGYVAVREPVFPPADVADGDWHILVVDDGEVSRYDDVPEPDLSDVPERAVDLFLLIRDEADGPVTAGEVVELADEYGGDLDVDAAERTVRGWVKQLADVGALQSGEYRANEGREYQPVCNSL